MDTISEYIDFSDNEELWREAKHMGGLGQSILEEGYEQGIEQGIRAFVESCQELGISLVQTMEKLIAKFSLPEGEARKYVDKYWM